MNEAMVVPNIEVVALSPGEMGQAQEGLIEWCRSKIAEVGGEVADARERLRVTSGTALYTDAFTRQAQKADKQLTFYRKLLSALQAGYLIVPNFPIDVFAIRTKRVNPDENPARSQWLVGDQPPQMLPEGEGRYVSPGAVLSLRTHERVNPTTKEIVKEPEYYALDFREIGWPAALASPRVLEATNKALALKLFDEVGLVGSPAPKKDPIVVGRIYSRRTPVHSQHFTTFFVAWWLNTRAL